MCITPYPSSNELLINFKPASHYYDALHLLPDFNHTTAINDFDTSYNYVLSLAEEIKHVHFPTNDITQDPITHA